MTTLQLKVAVWTQDKPYNYNLLHKDMTLEARVKALEAAVGKARTWLDAPSGRTELMTLRIFVAPENVLVDSKQVGQNPQDKSSAVSFSDFKLFCQQDKLTQVCTGVLPELSQGLLFIPGTVLWKKPLEALEALKLDKHEARLRSSYRAEYPNAPKSFETEFVKVEQGKLTQKVKHITEKTQGLPENQRDIQIARNVALVFYDGRLIFKYKKRTEHKQTKQTGELTSGDKKAHDAIKFFPGHREGVFPLQVGESTLSCGIEICADHAGSQLRYSAGAGNLQLQFIISDHVSNIPHSVAVKAGGYIIHASTDRDVSGLFDHQFKQASSSAPHSDKLEQGMLTYHEQLLTLPIS